MRMIRRCKNRFRVIMAREKECKSMMQKVLEGEWVAPFNKMPSIQNYITYSRFVSAIKLCFYQEVHSAEKKEKAQKLMKTSRLWYNRTKL